MERNGLLEVCRDGKAEIKVVAAGGAGINTIHRLNEMGLKNVELVAINTHRVHLDLVHCQTKILVGEDITGGYGCSGEPNLGFHCLSKANKAIAKTVGSPDILFMIAGMGGGTGTPAAVIVSQIAKRNGAFVVGVATMPFQFEGRRHQRIAIEGLRRFRKEADVVIVIENDRLLDFASHLTVEEALSIIDHLIAGLIRNMVKKIKLPTEILEKELTNEGGLIPKFTLFEEEEEIEEEHHHKKPILTPNYPAMAEVFDDTKCPAESGVQIADRVSRGLKFPTDMPGNNVFVPKDKPFSLTQFFVPPLVKDEKFVQSKFIVDDRDNGDEIMSFPEKDEKVRKTEIPNEPVSFTQTRLDNAWI
jgi:hypothetical protein